MAKRYWLMKTEPESFSISDLERVQVEPWSGVRSHFARAHMRAMTVGDDVLFYHSSCEPPGVAGLAVVARTGVVDETQFDPESRYYDPKATRDAPRWDCVDVRYVSTMPHYVALARIRADPRLAEMMLLKRGMRLSVQPIEEHEYVRIVELGQLPPPPEPPKPPKPPRVKRPSKSKRKVTKPKPPARRKRTPRRKPS